MIRHFAKNRLSLGDPNIPPQNEVRIANCALSRNSGAYLEESHKRVASGPPKEPNPAVAFSRLVAEIAETRQRENGNKSGRTAEATTLEKSLSSHGTRHEHSMLS
ncbi:uncharacterized protein EAF02_007805 [Botrytis sinoallii]|uniref:uncharacterized protein n=1 Tax=Botrytis sinoallii TaxID=1463999 RepID=UPI001900B347|nr:uncharacterized protein EAF02_007805 [Botrytis sinoallii]KAF7879635.1 hypothetical protein EAF02_007805 [Botrytis sinoallii]